MKRKLLSYLILLAITTTMNAQTTIKIIEEQILEVKNTFAPDKRTAIFDIHITDEGGRLLVSGETNLPDAKENLLKRISDTAIKDEIKVLPDENLGEKSFGIVNISVANMRTKPEHAAEMATQALLGTVLKIYKKTDDDWYLVQTPDNYISWVDGEALQRVTKEEAENWKSSGKIIITSNYSTAFEEQNEKRGEVSDLVFGDLVKLLSSSSEFYQIEFPDGRKAFVKNNAAENFDAWLKNRNCTIENIITTAKKFMGIPYLWGGTSSKGLDCSGFTKTVFFANGIILPRDASQQVFVGQTVNSEKDFSQLQPGDLLFFGTAANQNRKEKITHVAIYLGDNDFIHASGRVHINSFDKAKNIFSRHRLSTFIRAKRVVSSLNENGIQSIDSNNFYH